MVESLLSRFNAGFLVAAFIPALAFVVLANIVFRPIVPDSIAAQLGRTLSFGGDGRLLSVTIIAAVLGFALSSLNTFLYKTYEGYFLLRRFRYLRRRRLKAARQLQSQIKNMDKQILRLKQRSVESTRTRQRIEKRLRILNDKRYRLTADYDRTYPPSSALILPTRFGNLFRAAESYGVYRYKMDSVPLWPRMVYAMDDKYYQRLEQNNDGLAFLINCSVLSLLMAGLCALALLYQIWLCYLRVAGYRPPFYFIEFEDPQHYLDRILIYFLLGLAMLFLFRLFYEAAIPVLSRYGNLIRSAYDIFRFQLMKVLRIKLPSGMDFEMEKVLWDKTSHFISVGEQLGPMEFEYQEGAAQPEDKA